MKVIFTGNSSCARLFPAQSAGAACGLLTFQTFNNLNLPVGLSFHRVAEYLKIR